MHGEVAFGEWLQTLLGGGDEDAGLDIDDREWLHQVFLAHGAVDLTELTELRVVTARAAAERALPIIAKEISEVTGLRPAVSLRAWTEPDHAGHPVHQVALVIDLDGHGVTRSRALRATAEAAVLVEIAEIVTGEISEDLDLRWPTCPEHECGMDPAVVDQQAVWRCRAKSAEVIAPIGGLAAAR